MSILSASSDSVSPAPGSLLPASTPTIFTLSIPVANTDTALVIPVGTKRISIRARIDANILVADSPGDIALGTYYTIPSLCEMDYDKLYTNAGLTLYVQCGIINVLEITTWS